jgi:hypothetical protein
MTYTINNKLLQKYMCRCISILNSHRTIFAKKFITIHKVVFYCFAVDSLWRSA